MTELVIGAPVWDRAWSLPLWFESVTANVDPEKTGLIFVVPSTDVASRNVIAALAEPFAWFQVLRDPGPQSERMERPETRHRTLAAARNQILRVVNQIRPRHFLSWDSDLLVPPGTVDSLRPLGLPLVTTWTWLNRRPPVSNRYQDFKTKVLSDVIFDPPVCATAMDWDERHPGRAVHYPPYEFLARGSGVWSCRVTLGWQLMDNRAYSVASYAPHYDSEHVPFAWQLEQRGVSRHCAGEIRGVHLYDPKARDEIGMGWPGVMRLAEQAPLASYRDEERSPEYVLFGFFSPQAGASREQT